MNSIQFQLVFVALSLFTLLRRSSGLHCSCCYEIRARGVVANNIITLVDFARVRTHMASM